MQRVETTFFKYVCFCFVEEERPLKSLEFYSIRAHLRKWLKDNFNFLYFHFKFRDPIKTPNPQILNHHFRIFATLKCQSDSRYLWSCF